MNFSNTQYLPHIIAGSIVFAVLVIYLNSKYFKWVKTYWFFERTWISRFSTLIYVISLFLMLSSLLDLRGPEEKVKTNLPDQKTIIILDSSSSMLAEDIRPSRFGKAIQLARHFVKNAAGHQVSVVLFSDIQKRLIPFTDDIDLLDSRLAALEKTNAVSGGSNIGQAISEAVGYFDTDGDRKAANGNILVFTDAEESDGSFDVELGNNINLAVVGIGTAKGANIPLRWEDGSFRGYKTNKGEPVITKLDEDYIKKIGKNVKNYKYWIANSYSLPTEDIMNFFRSIYNKTNGKGDMRVRPVFSHLILIPAIILYCISIVLGRFASFKTVVSFLIVAFLSLSSSAYAQESQDEEKKEKPLPPALIRDLQKMKKGKADRKEILKIAENLLKNNDEKRASELYKEYAKPDDEQEVTFNRATALLKAHKLDEAMPLIQQVYKNAANEEIKDKMRHNVLLAMNSDKNSQNKNKDDKKDDKKNDKKDGEQDKKDKDGKQGDKPKDDKSKDKDSKDPKDGQDQKQDKKDNKDSKDNKDEKEKKDPQDLDKPDRPETAPKSLKEKEQMIEQKRKMVKTPAMIKQILNDDRELQKKMMDTSTNERGAPKPKRDW